MPSLTIKRTLAAAGVALLLGGAAVGVVGAQQTPTPPTGQQTSPAQTRYQQFLDAVAAKLGITSDKLKQAIDQTRQEQGLQGRRIGPHGWGWGFPGARGHLRGVLGHELTVAAKAIGIDASQLRQELPGKSLADVARAHNVDPATVATALKTDADSRIDSLVTNGRLQADRAAELKQRAEQRIDQLMNRTLPAGKRSAAPSA